MALRESTHPVRAVGRHGRPRPFGGRLRLPTLRFSGAAMAMSTVVGISLATTWLLNEQQHVGRQPGMSVGASPPVPSADTADTLSSAAPVASVTPAPSADASRRTQPPSPARPGPSRPAAQPSGTPSGSASAPPPAAAVAAAGPSVPDQSDDSASASPSGTPSAPPSETPTTTAPAPTQPPRLADNPGPAPTQLPVPPTRLPVPPAPVQQPAISATAGRDELGSSGTRHSLELTVGEQLTALQVEFRLQRPEVLPGTTPWTDLPDAIATVSLERDTLVYRFTLPPGLDLAPGRYTFTVLGGGAGKGPHVGKESWTASAFALAQPRAVALRGLFG